MVQSELDYLIARVEKLNPNEQLLLIARIVSLLRNQPSTGQPSSAEIETWDEDELQALLDDNHPRTTQEIVANGFFGGWEDMGITDSLEWVEQQRAKTKDRYSW